jgi:hypothetical protein
MASEVDPNVFPDNQMVAKSDLRTQMQIIANEITALQLQVSPIRNMAFNDAVFDTL